MLHPSSSSYASPSVSSTRTASSTRAWRRAGIVGACAAAVLVVACGGDDENNGVNDVRAACELRAQWKNPTASHCVTCMAAAPLEGCDCEDFRDYGGLCSSQGNARSAEASCTMELDDCVRACEKTDCTCIEGCYAGADRCKSLSAARDGCVAEICAKYCN